MRSLPLLALLTATGCDALELPIPLLTTATPEGIDVELVDEGVLTGEVPDLALDVKLYDERTGWYLPAYLDNAPWGPVLLADSVLRAEGQPALLQVDVSSLQWPHDEPLALEVLVEAEYGRASNRAAGATDLVRPDACSIVVTSQTSRTEHAADITACLAAWADANGAPAGLHLRIESATAVSDWAFAARYVLSTSQPTEAGCTGPQVLDHDAADLPAGIELDGVSLWGLATAGTSSMRVVTWENTFRGDAWTPSAGGISSRHVPAGATRALKPATFPSDWSDRSLDTLVSEDGFVDACAVVVHEGAAGPASVRLAATVGYR